MKNTKPVVLLLTATISPPKNCPDLKRNDPQVRLNDYLEALRFYLKIPSKYIGKIVFVENSDSDLSPLRNLVAHEKTDKTVEFLEYEGGNDFPPEYGKGYGEMLILNYAMDNSKIISDDDIVWKATGRLALLNIEKLIRTSPTDLEIYCDLHNSFKALSLEHFFDPRFYAFKKKTYEKYFRLSKEELRGAHIEHKFFDPLKAALGTPGVYLRFRHQPQIGGYVGSVDNSYSSWKKQIQRSAQQLLRVIFPKVWL